MGCSLKRSTSSTSADGRFVEAAGALVAVGELVAAVEAAHSAHAQQTRSKPKIVRNIDLNCTRFLAARNDPDDFQAVVRVQLSSAKLGRGDRFAVEFDHNAAWEELLSDQELLEAAGKFGLHSFAIRYHPVFIHRELFLPGQRLVKAASQSFQTGS